MEHPPLLIYIIYRLRVPKKEPLQVFEHVSGFFLLGGVENLSYTVPTYGATNTPNLSAAGVAAGGGRVVNQTINVQAIDPAAVASVIAARERVALGA